MNETPNIFAQSGIPVCARCGERPGRVRLVFANGNQRGEATLCEVCAQDVMAQNGGELPTGAAAQRTPQTPKSKTPALDEFGRDLTADAAEGRIDPVIGRDDEIEQAVEILARRRKNNAVLIGEPGVGKTAIVEGLARRVVEGDVPATLRDARIVTVDLSGMIAGAQFRGQFEQRFKAALQEAVDADTVGLLVDELQTILAAGNAEGRMDAASMLKPLLARGELRMVGATTLSEYR